MRRRFFVAHDGHHRQAVGAFGGHYPPGGIEIDPATAFGCRARCHAAGVWTGA